MIQADRFITAFGSGGSVEQTASLAASLDFAVLAVSTLPGREKAPICPLGVVARKRADAAAQTEAAEAGRRNPDRVRHACGVHHATTDPPAAVKAIRAARKREHAEPNVGIEVGRSRIVLVDCDTPAEVAGWRDLVPEAGPPTVSTPGKQNDAGEWVHSRGGHWYFTVPDDLELPESPGSLVLPGAGAMYWRSRLALVPPSVRSEGPYRITGTAAVLPDLLQEMILEAGQRSAQRREAVATRVASGDVDPLDQWAANTPWSEILEADGWSDTGHADRTCGCSTWTRPGEDVSSTRSAIAHDLGCARFECETGHGPLYLFTDNPPEFLAELVAAGRRTVTKPQYIAARDHDGSVPALISALGLSPGAADLDEALDDLGEPAVEAPVKVGAPVPSRGASLELLDLHDRTPSRIMYAFEPYVPLGMITIMPGPEGSGKTALCYRFAADLTRGLLPGDLHGSPRGVLVLAPEDNVDTGVVPRLSCAGADMTMVKVVASRFEGDKRRGLELPRDLPLLVEPIEALDVGLIIIDSLVSVFPSGSDTRKYADVNRVLFAINRLAEATGVAVLCPWHLNKSQSPDAASRTMDSRAFRTASRSVVYVMGDPTAVGEGILALDKANSASLHVPALRFIVEGAPYDATFRDPRTGLDVTKPASAPVARIVGPEEGSGVDALRRMVAMATMQPVDDPKHWLRSYLADHGETLRNKVMEAAEAAGFSGPRVQRAAKGLGVGYRSVTVPKEDGQPPTRHTAWRLPDDLEDDLDELAPRSESHHRGRRTHRDDRDDGAPGDASNAVIALPEAGGSSVPSAHHHGHNPIVTPTHDRDDRDDGASGENLHATTTKPDAHRRGHRGRDSAPPREMDRNDGALSAPAANQTPQKHTAPVDMGDTESTSTTEEVEHGQHGASTGDHRPARSAGEDHGDGSQRVQPEAAVDPLTGRVAAKVIDSPGITERGLIATLCRNGTDPIEVSAALVAACRLGMVENRAGSGVARLYPRTAP